MGSASDWPTMQHCALTLKELGVPCEYQVLSAHRTPKESKAYAESARERGWVTGMRRAATLERGSLFSPDLRKSTLEIAEYKRAQKRQVQLVSHNGI